MTATVASPSGSSTSVGGRLGGDPVDLRLPGADHEVVVGRVVGDVAGPVGLLQPADAVLHPRGARDRPRRGPASPGRAGRGGTPPSGRRWARSRSPPRRSGPAGRRRPGSPTARRRWPGSRRTAGSPASGRSARSGPPRARRRSSRRGSAGAITGTGASPLRPNIACSRSDCSVFVGRPVEGPPRCTSTITSGSSVMTARPMVSDFSETPGPGRRRDARARRRRRRRARRRCRRSRPRPGTCARRTPCAWTARAGCPTPG